MGFVHFEIMLRVAERIAHAVLKARLRQHRQMLFEQTLIAERARRQPGEAVAKRDRTLIVISGLVPDL